LAWILRPTNEMDVNHFVLVTNDARIAQRRAASFKRANRANGFHQKPDVQIVRIGSWPSSPRGPLERSGKRGAEVIVRIAIGTMNKDEGMRTVRFVRKG
jgi:hypothetical protein